MNNPFNPSFGKVPNIFLDRTHAVTKLSNELQDPNSPYQTTLIYGVRGVGKTSLLTDIGNKMSAKKNWLVVNLATNYNVLQTLIDSICQKSSPEIKRLLDKIEGIKLSAFGIQFEYHPQELTETNYQILLENILDKLQTKNISLLVTIDEVDPTPEIKNFISLYQLLIRENYQISLIMTGLPNKLSELQNDDVLTFLLRSARMQLSSLDLLSIKHSYQDTFAKKGIAISDDVLVAMVKKTKGYAYSFQLLGYLLWEIADKKITFATLEQIQGEYLATLSRNVYYKVLQELSPVDHSFVIAMAKAPIEASFTIKGYEDVTAGIVKWPMSVIRLQHAEPDRLVDLADHILELWRGYTDKDAFIFAETDGEPHNTITPIARKRGEIFELDLVLRNNITTEEHPLGVYHPHAELHHIKKENIGLIEVMGLAVLPARLKPELELLAEYMVSGKDIRSNETLEKHADWVEEFLPKYGTITQENVMDIIQEEVGIVFMKVLECAGVYKCDEKGRKDFRKFIDLL